MNKEARIDDVVKRLFDNIEFSNEPRRLYDPLRYMIEIGGKRVRPRLCLSTTEFCIPLLRWKCFIPLP